MSTTTCRMPLSQNIRRDKQYWTFVTACHHQKRPLKELIQLGAVLMRKEKIYHHFFANHSFSAIATHLALFALKLPLEVNSLSREISAEEALNIIHLFEKRIAERLPIAYITQETVYLGRTFYVNENVLVPRSLMHTRFKDFLQKITWENYRVLDLCTGSGCIGITLALLNPQLTIDLADISPEALTVATANVQRFGLEARVHCIQSNLFTNIREKYDLIITNPPYVTDYEYERQPPEIRNEPVLALKAGKEGLDLINQILLQAKNYLNPQGALIAELGFGVTQLLKKRYPTCYFEGFCYKRPQEERSRWSKFFHWIDLLFEWSGYLDGVVLWERKNLPIQLSHKNYFIRSIILRSYRFLHRNLFNRRFN